MLPDTFYKKNFVTKVVVGGLIAILLLAYVYINNRQASLSKTSTLPSIQPASPTSVPRLGDIELSLSDQLKKTVGQTVTVVLTAGSAGRLIAGYDLALSYDPTAFQFSQAQSLISGYTAYSFIDGGHLALTTPKQPQATALPFDQIPIIKLVFIAKKTGNYSFALEPVIAKDKTQMVDTQSNIIVPQTGSVTIAIY